MADLGLLTSAARASGTNQLGAVYVFGNRIKMKMERLSGFSLGGFAHEGLLFGSFPVNCVGLGYLSRYFVVFDFPRGRMYLRPGKEFNRADVSDLSTLGLIGRDERILVTEVPIGGPAAAAGIHKDDELVEIDGQKVRAMTYSKIKRRLCVEGRHSLVVRRGGAEVPINLRLRNELPEPAAKQQGSRDNVTRAVLGNPKRSNQ